MSKVRGLSIESGSCIVLLMHGNVVIRLIKLHNHSIICTIQELGNEANYSYMYVGSPN